MGMDSLPAMAYDEPAVYNNKNKKISKKLGEAERQ